MTPSYVSWPVKARKKFSPAKRSISFIRFIFEVQRASPLFNCYLFYYDMHNIGLNHL